MAIREFAGASKATALSGTITAAATSINVIDGAGYPTGSTGPFVITISAGLASEEKVLVATRTGNTLSVATSGRGYDGTTASDHANAASVQHTISAVDLREANAHVNATVDAHDASAISYAGSTDLVAVDVEAALDELDAEKISTTAANAAYQAKASAFEVSGLSTEHEHFGWVGFFNDSSYTGFVRASGGNQNDYVLYRLPELQAGTWRLAVGYLKNPDAGIIHVAHSIDGVTFTAAGTIDGYDAAKTAARTQLSGVTIPDGTKFIRLRMETKNASATNFTGRIDHLSGVRTGA